MIGDTARDVARRAAVSAALLVAALVLFAVASGFGGIGVFLWLEPLYGPVTASFAVAGGGIVLAAGLVFMATRARGKPMAKDEASRDRGMDRREDDAKPVETAIAVASAGFLAGLFTGRP
jgi:hypothetical protein